MSLPTAPLRHGRLHPSPAHMSMSIYMYIYVYICILCIPIYTHNLRISLSRTLTVALRHGRLHPPPARRHQDLHVGRPAPAMRPHAIPLHPAHVPPRAHRAWRIRPRSRRRAKDNLQLSAG